MQRWVIWTFFGSFVLLYGTFWTVMIVQSAKTEGLRENVATIEQRVERIRTLVQTKF